jgi:hypothetical protein
MWKTQKRTARGWEHDEKFPSEKGARKYWRELVFSLCTEPMRLIDDTGEVVDTMNTETEKGNDDARVQELPD